jgi:hypothetical protein
MEELESAQQLLIDAVLLGLEDVPPIPVAFTNFAKKALNWRSVDALATQLSDSAVDDQVGVRGASVWRTINFSHKGTELQVSVLGDVLVLRFEPSVAAVCDVETVRTRRTCAAGDDGGFHAEGIEFPFRLSLQSEGASWVTPWVTG